MEDVKGISKGKGGASYVVFSRGSGGWYLKKLESKCFAKSKPQSSRLLGTELNSKAAWDGVNIGLSFHLKYVNTSGSGTNSVPMVVLLHVHGKKLLQISNAIN